LDEVRLQRVGWNETTYMRAEVHSVAATLETKAARGDGRSR